MKNNQLRIIALETENKLLKEQLAKAQQPVITYQQLTYWEYLKKVFFNRYFPLHFLVMAFLKGSYLFFIKETGYSPDSFWRMIINFFKSLF